jgi:mRNA interferase HicA
MKREALLRHLRRYGCVLRREGKEHSLWENPQTGHVPRHAEVANLLAEKICRKLSLPEPWANGAYALAPSNTCAE